MYKRSPKRFRSRNSLLAILGGAGALVLALALFFTHGPFATEEPRQLTYSEMMTALEEDRIAEVTFVDGAVVEGRLRTGAGEAAEESFETLLPLPNGDYMVERFEAAGVPIDARAGDEAVSGYLVPMLPWAVLLILLAVLLFKGPGAQYLQHSRSRSRLARHGRGQVSFADVAGAEEAKADLEEIVEFLKDPKKFTRLGGRMPRGTLLTGEPGNGKTLLARAVAGEARCEYFSASGSDFVEMFVGTGAARIRDLFREAREHAPAIIFIDEIDAIGRRRSDGASQGGQDEREQALNQLLVEMDGFEPGQSVVVLAATNRPDVLDPALLRRGRFDRRVTVDYPDLRGRVGILKVHTAGVPLAPDVSLEAMARGTGGMSGADLASIANEAALGAARRGSVLVEMEDMEEARDRVLMGSARRSMVLTADEKRLTAYHEAGHAIIGLVLPGLDPVHKVTIVPRERALGVTASLPERDRHTHSRAQLRARLVMLMAGRAAEELVLGEDEVTTGAGGDIQHATRIARQMIVRYGMSPRLGMVDLSGRDEPLSAHTAQLVDEEVRRMVDEAYRDALRILDECRDLLDRMAEALLARETIGRPELELLHRGEPLPPPAGAATSSFVPSPG
jgi:cell division protease FtsH